jgi:hypothetical protein
MDAVCLDECVGGNTQLALTRRLCPRASDAPTAARSVLGVHRTSPVLWSTSVSTICGHLEPGEGAGTHLVVGVELELRVVQEEQVGQQHHKKEDHQRRLHRQRQRHTVSARKTARPFGRGRTQGIQAASAAAKAMNVKKTITSSCSCCRPLESHMAPMERGGGGGSGGPRSDRPVV